MGKKIRFIDPKKTKELQESMRDHGRASTYWGLIIIGFFYRIYSKLLLWNQIINNLQKGISIRYHLFAYVL